MHDLSSSDFLSVRSGRRSRPLFIRALKNNMHKGTFIVIDGGEGVGKSTVIRRLQDEYGDHIVTTHEPGGCERAEAIRAHILSEVGKGLSPEEQHELFWQARQHHMHELIIPALDAGKVVVSDRFDSSTWAYQIAVPHRQELIPEFWRLRKAVLGAYTPDHYLILQADVHAGMRRTKNRGQQTHFDAQGYAFHARVSVGMAEFAHLSDISATVIDANQSPEDVYMRVCESLEPFFPG